MEKMPDDSVNIEDIIARMGRAMFTEPAMCTSWVLVCEWSNGVDYWTSTITDEQSPPWRHTGLMNYAAENYESDLTVLEEETEDEYGED